MNLKPFTVFVGSDPAVRAAVLALAEKAGYDVHAPKAMSPSAQSEYQYYRFTLGDSGFSSVPYDKTGGWYGDLPDQFNAVTQITPLINFIFNVKPVVTLNVEHETHTVEFFPNGDVKVGCTTVSSAKFEELVKGREEAMKEGAK